MHANIEQLLEIRDCGIKGHAMQRHVESCDVCLGEMQRLTELQARMRAFPEVAPPDLRWATIVGRAHRPSRTWVPALGWGIAASLLIGAWLAGNLSGRDGRGDTLPEMTADATLLPTREDGLDTVPGQDLAFSTLGIDDLISRSQKLESVLSRLPRRPNVVRLGTDDTINSLTNTIAMVDYTLNQPGTSLTDDQSRALWQQRVSLMDSLVRVRYVEASQEVF